MSETSILLKAYYEALYERLEARKGLLAARIEKLLAEEIAVRGYEGRAEPDMPAERSRLLAEELIEQVGAFPDNSIIAAYEAEPALQKLPDYLVA